MCRPTLRENGRGIARGGFLWPVKFFDSASGTKIGTCGCCCYQKTRRGCIEFFRTAFGLPSRDTCPPRERRTAACDRTQPTSMMTAHHLPGVSHTRTLPESQGEVWLQRAGFLENTARLVSQRLMTSPTNRGINASDPAQTKQTHTKLSLP